MYVYMWKYNVLECLLVALQLLSGWSWEVSWGSFGGVLGGLGGVLGRLGGVLGGSWGVLGAKACWHTPGAPPKGRPSWPKLTQVGPKLRSCWAQVGPSWAQDAYKTQINMHAKMRTMLMLIFHRFLVDFWSILEGFWRSCWPPRCIRKWCQIWMNFWSFFYWFSSHVDLPESLNFANSPRRIGFFTFLLDARFSTICIDFRCYVRSQNLPKICQKSIKNDV